MGMVSGKRQLAAAGLGGLGSNSRGDKVVLSETAKVLVAMADSLITNAVSNLKKGGHDSTGALASNIKSSELLTKGTKMSVIVYLPLYGDFQDKGVKPAPKEGSGKVVLTVNAPNSPYSFKTKYPSKKMVDAIKKWVNINVSAARGDDQKRGLSKLQKKTRGVAKMVKPGADKNALAYAIATNIKKKGIKPTRFFTNALNDTKKTFKDKIAQGFKIDIVNSI